MRRYEAEIEHRIAGIPCLIGVIYFASEAQTWDDPGSVDAEWEVLDRRGRPAPWLERKVDSKEEDAIFEAVCREMEDQ